MFSSFLSVSSNTNPESQVYEDIRTGLAPTSWSDQSLITNQESYNSMVRPRGVRGKNINIDENGALLISITMSLGQIVSLDEKNQILTTNVNLYLMWQDPRLIWDPMNYSGVYYIQVPANKFWLPDLSIMNAAGATNLIPIASNQLVGIDCRGNTYLTINLPSLQTRCALDVKNYPFDTQKCSIVVGSWFYSTIDINLRYNDYLNYSRFQYFDKSEYIEHPYWQLNYLSFSFVFTTTRFKQANYFNRHNNYSLRSEDISFDLVVKRRPMYVMINTIYINFVLNIVILMAFFMTFSSQIGLCNFIF
jgi:nicotinic acetylcholine receptor gamma